MCFLEEILHTVIKEDLSSFPPSLLLGTPFLVLLYPTDVNPRIVQDIPKPQLASPH